MEVVLELELELETSHPNTSDLNANVCGLPQRRKLECLSLEGWTRVERVRQSGKSAGKVDRYYQSPTGKIVRSQPELSRILGEQRDLSMVSLIPIESDRSDQNHMETDPSKCDTACDTACPKLAESLYNVPGDILPNHMEINPSKCDTACDTTCPKFPKSHYNLPGDILPNYMEIDPSKCDTACDITCPKLPKSIYNLPGDILPNHMEIDPSKSDTARDTTCPKLPKSLYNLPGDILDQLTASPIDTLKQLVITKGVQQSHIKTLFKFLAKATAIKEIDVNGNFRSGSLVATDVALVLGRCTKIKLRHFKETPGFWKKCMTSMRNNCQEFTVVECNGLETIVIMLPGLLPTLIRLELINPDKEGFPHVKEKKQLFSSFFKVKVSQESQLQLLALDHLQDLLLDVPPEILVPALAPLTSFSICRTSLNLEQVDLLVKSWKELTPVSVSVESSCGGWNQLASNIFVPSITNISSLSLKGVQLKKVVLRNLLSAVAGDCAVKKLDLRGNDMSGIAADVVVAAMHKLKVAVFTKCELDEEAVLEMLWSLVKTDDYQGELEELHLTRPRYTFDMTKEEELVKLVKEGAGLSCLEICAGHCKCEQYCSWRE